MQCPGCSNVFFSQKSLRVHLSEDHNVAEEELEHILSTFQASNDRELKNQDDLESNLSKDEEQASLNMCSEDITQQLNDHSCSHDKSSEIQPLKSSCLKKGTPMSSRRFSGEYGTTSLPQQYCLFCAEYLFSVFYSCEKKR